MLRRINCEGENQFRVVYMARGWVHLSDCWYVVYVNAE